MKKPNVTWHVTHSDGRVEVWTELQDALESVGLAPAEFADAWLGAPMPEAGARIDRVSDYGDDYVLAIGYNTNELVKMLERIRDGKGVSIWDRPYGYARETAIRVAGKAEGWIRDGRLSC